MKGFIHTTEVEAMKEVIQLFSLDHWAIIKHHYSQELKDRTIVQIKDCVHTFTCNNQLGT